MDRRQSSATVLLSSVLLVNEVDDAPPGVAKVRRMSLANWAKPKRKKPKKQLCLLAVDGSLRVGDIGPFIWNSAWVVEGESDGKATHFVLRGLSPPADAPSQSPLSIMFRGSPENVTEWLTALRKLDSEKRKLVEERKRVAKRMGSRDALPRAPSVGNGLVGGLTGSSMPASGDGGTAIGNVSPRIPELSFGLLLDKPAPAPLVLGEPLAGSIKDDGSGGGADEADEKRIDAVYQYLVQRDSSYVGLFPDPEHFKNNTLFQRLTTDTTVLDPALPDVSKGVLATSFVSLVEDFLHTAQEYGRVIISEVFLPAREKTIKPVSVGGVIGGEKFIVGNVLFKFAIDQGVFGGDHSSAAKVAGLELQGLRAYYGTQTEGLHFPLMAMIDKKGFRLIASSLLPLGKNSLIYGSNDAAKTIHRDNEELNRLVQIASARLNLKPHNCGANVEVAKMMYSCVDLEGHIGRDGRFYLLDFSRAMPPVTPGRAKQNSHLFEMFRPEFVATHPVPLCSDAYSRFTMAMPDFDQNNKEVDEALFALLHGRVPEFAPTFKAAFTTHLARNKGDVTDFRVSALMHEHGINVRYMGNVLKEVVGAARLNESSQPSVMGFLDCLDDEEGRKRYGSNGAQREEEDEEEFRADDMLVLEMVARIAKNEIRTQLRKKMEELRVPVDEPFKGVVVKLLNELFGLSKESGDFWAGVVIPSVEAKFGINITKVYKRSTNFRRTVFKRRGFPFGLWNRIKDMLGLQFVPTIYDLMRSESSVFDVPVIFDVADVTDLGERVKTLDFISMAHAYLTALSARRLEDAQLWDAARADWMHAVHHSREALRHRPNDPVRLALAAQCYLYMDQANVKSRSVDRPQPQAMAEATLAAGVGVLGLGATAGASILPQGKSAASLELLSPDLAMAQKLSDRAIKYSSLASSALMDMQSSPSIAAASAVNMASSVLAQLVRAEVMEQAGLIEEAERVFLRLVSEHAGSPDCLVRYARFLQRNGDPEMAQRFTELASQRGDASDARLSASAKSVKERHDFSSRMRLERLASHQARVFSHSELNAARHLPAIEEAEIDDPYEMDQLDGSAHFSLVNGTLVLSKGSWIDLLASDDDAYWSAPAPRGPAIAFVEPANAAMYEVAAAYMYHDL